MDDYSLGGTWMKSIRLLAILVALSLLALTGLGCSAVAEQAAEEIVEGTTGVDVEADGENITITGDDGETLEIDGSGSDLPDGFPEDMPVYDGEIEGSSTISSGEGTNYYVALRSDDDFETVQSWYKDELAASDWEIVADSEISVDGLSSALFSVKKGETEAAMSVVQEEDGGVIITTNVIAP